MARNTNIYQHNIDVHDISKFQKRKPKMGGSRKVLEKDRKKVIEASQTLI